MGNVLCGIVPTDMVCGEDEHAMSETEKNMIFIKHYNNFVIDKNIEEKQHMDLGSENNRKKHKVGSLPSYRLKPRDFKESRSVENNRLFVSSET